jgi:hypothetical protein
MTISLPEKTYERRKVVYPLKQRNYSLPSVKLKEIT